MSTIIIGGQSRRVGKTSVVAGLIAALPEFHWTAFKITQDHHGAGSAADPGWAISDEQDRSGKSDTSRYLAAGAAHAWWVRTSQARLADALPEIQSKLAECRNVIVESNSILEFLKPDLYLIVLDPATTDFKRSAQQYMDRADALILHAGTTQAPVWRDVSMRAVAGRPLFYISPPQYVTPQIVEFVREKLKKLEKL
jgi:molybdopterin-guanine dinucleotide biosynthesis protein